MRRSSDANVVLCSVVAARQKYSKFVIRPAHRKLPAMSQKSQKSQKASVDQQLNDKRHSTRAWTADRAFDDTNHSRGRPFGGRAVACISVHHCALDAMLAWRPHALRCRIRSHVATPQQCRARRSCNTGTLSDDEAAMLGATPSVRRYLFALALFGGAASFSRNADRSCALQPPPRERRIATAGPF